MKELRFISRYVRRHALQYILGIAALFAVDIMNVYIPQFTGICLRIWSFYPCAILTSIKPET